MARAEVSQNNPYWISKHRHYELKHFCRQYPTWKKEYAALSGEIPLSRLEKIPSDNTPGDPTAECAMKKAYYLERIKLVEKAAAETDRALCDYILKGVTEGLSYSCLKSRLKIPCGKDMYYDRYRRFFYILSESRA